MSTIPNPLALVCELTHRCPLHCVYCSNPRELAARNSELDTETWTSVLRQAAALGVLQADFTGGEPLARTDIVKLVRAARSAGLYVSLITSGLPLDEAKLDALVDAGLDHFQLSFQAATENIAEEISGTKTHAQKLRVLEWLKSRRVGVTLNFVLHRCNLHQMDAMLAIAESSSASRVEFANVQYYGWGFANRDLLLPTRPQLDEFMAKVKSAEERLRGKIRVEYEADGQRVPCPLKWLDSFSMRNFTNATVFDDTLPLADGYMEVGTAVPTEQLKDAMEDWFYRKSYLPKDSHLILAEISRTA